MAQVNPPVTQVNPPMAQVNPPMTQVNVAALISSRLHQHTKDMKCVHRQQGLGAFVATTAENSMTALVLRVELPSVRDMPVPHPSGEQGSII
eukprot:gene13814-biopygen3749